MRMSQITVPNSVIHGSTLPWTMRSLMTSFLLMYCWRHCSIRFFTWDGNKWESTIHQINPLLVIILSTRLFIEVKTESNWSYINTVAQHCWICFLITFYLIKIFKLTVHTNSISKLTSCISWFDSFLPSPPDIIADSGLQCNQSMNKKINLSTAPTLPNL